jgi:hypothetical protein
MAARWGSLEPRKATDVRYLEHFCTNGHRVVSPLFHVDTFVVIELDLPAVALAMHNLSHKHGQAPQMYVNPKHSSLTTFVHFF